QSAVRKRAAAVLLVRTWKQGSRHDISMALACALLRNGWGTVQAKEFIEAIATAAGDEGLSDRMKAGDDTAAARDRGLAFTALPSLRQYLGDQAVSKIADWLGLQTDPEREASADDRPNLTDLGNAER